MAIVLGGIVAGHWQLEKHMLAAPSRLLHLQKKNCLPYLGLGEWEKKD